MEEIHVIALNFISLKSRGQNVADFKLAFLKVLCRHIANDLDLR